MLILLGFAFLAGIFTALSPCILPVLPAILAAGVAKGKWRPLGTILGLICSFSFFTLALTSVVQATGLSPSVLRYVAIALIFFFGAVMLLPKLSNWFAKVTTPVADLGQKIQGKHLRSGFWGGVVFGIALGLLWTPCAGPILAAITTLVATGAVSGLAILMTLFYSLGAGIPLFLIAYGSSKLIQASRLLSKHAERIRQFFGVLMILFAILLAFNWEMLLNEKISRFFPQLLSEKDLPVDKELKIIRGGDSLQEEGKAPEFTGIALWINSPPLTLSELKGKVVLVDFWTYTCINCLRTIPHLESLYEKYKDKGLVIVGVHTPEFEFEKSEDNVRQAVKDLRITYPVALDNNYATWNAYHNHYWPAHFLIDQQGIIRMEHFGEGGYIETENGVRALLGLSPLSTQESTEPTRPISPETYLGLSRAQNYQMDLIAHKTVDYRYEPPLREDRVGLRGLWRAEEESITAEGDNSYLDYHFLASHVYLVLSGTSDTPLEVLLDGEPYARIPVDGDRKYDIVNTSYGRHHLCLKVPRGIKAYAFTFGY